MEVNSTTIGKRKHSFVDVGDEISVAVLHIDFLNGWKSVVDSERVECVKGTTAVKNLETNEAKFLKFRFIPLKR